MKFFNQISLQTPESVELDFNLAGVGNRAYALLIDYIIWSLILLFVLMFGIFFSIQFLDIWKTFGGNNKQASLWISSILLLILFIIYVGYFVIFETIWQGQTPGKRYVKIRVIRDDGRPVRLQQTTLRALFRPVDDTLFIGMLLILFSKKEKRLGDWMAGTIVIQEIKAVADIISTSQTAKKLAKYLLEEADISQLLPEDFAVIREYLQRSKLMTKQAKIELSKKLASQAKEIIGLTQTPQKVSATEFLEAVYLAYQQK
ncbi:MAG: RDD family protein [Okeania sp. SIO2C2]|uniref:RDD family protein n=1 Tax=Okeania sp. SIO2C2 TaxID=2607787 RepID=UPI0013BCF7E0|nr:RDD family protein [Okeania sp. SIO2C2]NEP86183.1 RDD family protein [Okeania sp. SIO2C2]